MEIVSRPDIRGPEEAAEYVRKLRQILRYLGTCDGNMQEGSLRADVNVSSVPARRASDRTLGTRCEIKNMNSMRFISRRSSSRRAARSPSSRTAARSTRRPGSTTRTGARPARCAPRKRRTTTATSPTPTCCRWRLEQAWVDAIAAGLPELPDAKKARFVTDYGMTEYDAGVLTAEVASADFFEAVAAGRDGKQAANWVINELFGRLNKEGHGIEAARSTPAQLGGLIDLIGSGEISGKIAKDVFEILWTEGGDPAEIVGASAACGR